MGASNSLQYLIWLKSKTVKIYSVVQSVKLLLALSIKVLFPHLIVDCVRCLHVLACKNSK